MERRLRIHGDNIIECERTIKMIAEAFNAKYSLMESPLYLPKYIIETSEDVFEFELLSGHGRWADIDLGDIVLRYGGKLRETADAYITEIDGSEERVLFAIEYCSALPAGNNAWQRNGRALASVMANIPYLYYSEIGGVELDDNREPKLPRFPNPAVPFSYLSIFHDMGSMCLPVYQPHPSITNANREAFASAMGYGDGLQYIKAVLMGVSTEDIEQRLMQKAINMVQILSDKRRKLDTLRGEQWKSFMLAEDRSEWLSNFDGFTWGKKSAGKLRVSDTFPSLMAEVEVLGAKPITSKDLPFCIIPKERLAEFKKWITDTYEQNPNFSTDKDLAIVWITGFKPRGDDSRPDRGLAPFCRMILGKDANIMAVVYGPAKPATWKALKAAPDALCQSNGLFQAIFTCCNYLLVDSDTCDGAMFVDTRASFIKNGGRVDFPYTKNPEVDFYEHDIDCAIHQIMSAKERMDIYECFCNPPGGDWSGITYFGNGKEYKWTLPRVSERSKRPDHIIQINKAGSTLFVAIESKGLGRTLENNIGNRLKDYINDLFGSEPTAYKEEGEHSWQFFSGSIGKVRYKLVSVGAFLYRGDAEMDKCMARGCLDAVFAFEFSAVSTLHAKATRKGALLVKILRSIASEQGSFIVKVH